MSKKLALLATLALALACCVSLAGCKGSSESSKDFIGVWNLESVTGEADSVKVSASDVALMQSFGYTATLTLNEDGTASLDLFGEVSECEWTGEDQVSAQLVIDGQKVSLTLDEKGVLKMSQGESASIFFVRADAASSAAVPAAAQEGEGASSSSDAAGAGQASFDESAGQAAPVGSSTEPAADAGSATSGADATQGEQLAAVDAAGSATTDGAAG